MAWGKEINRIWAIRRDEARRVQSNGIVKIERVGQRIHVTCAHRDQFSQEAQELGGRWLNKSQVWTFKLVSKRIVIELAARIYGREVIQLVDL